MEYLLLYINMVPAGIYLFKVNDGSTRVMSEIYSKLTVKTQSGVSIVGFEQENITRSMLMQNNWHSKKEKFCSFFVEIYLQYKKVIKYSLLSKY